MTTQIFKNYIEFSNREDKSINGVTPDFAKEHPDYEEDNKSNSGCFNCHRCYNCDSCNNCTFCIGCNNITVSITLPEKNLLDDNTKLIAGAAMAAMFTLVSAAWLVASILVITS